MGPRHHEAKPKPYQPTRPRPSAYHRLRIDGRRLARHATARRVPMYREAAAHSLPPRTALAPTPCFAQKHALSAHPASPHPCTGPVRGAPRLPLASRPCSRSCAACCPAPASASASVPSLRSARIALRRTLASLSALSAPCASLLLLRHLFLVCLRPSPAARADQGTYADTLLR